MKRAGWLGIAMVMAASTSLQAGDAGDIIFSQDHPRKMRAEVIYERTDRELDITSEPARIRADLDADAYILRLQTEISRTARLDFDIGAMSAGSGSHRVVGGVGLRFLAFEHEGWRGGTFAQIRYSPDLGDRFELVDDERTRVKFDLIEGDAGFLVSYRFAVADQFHIAPYAGPIGSIVRLSGDTRSEDDGDEERRFRARQRQPVGLVAGVGLQFTDLNSLRVETRYFGDFSFSVAAAFVF